MALSGAETLYSFGGHDPTVWSPLLDHYRRPPCLRDDDRYSYSFGIAARGGSGTPTHSKCIGVAIVFVTCHCILIRLCFCVRLVHLCVF